MNLNLKLVNLKIAEKGISKGEFAKLIGMSREAFRNKMECKREWKINEIINIANVLEIPIYLLLQDDKQSLCIISKEQLSCWVDLLLDGNSKEVIKSINGALYGSI